MPNEPSLGELSRIIKEFRSDIRDDLSAINGRLDTFVLREVYSADKAALEARLARMEREAESARAAARTALYACIATIIGGVLVGIILAVLVTGGGPPK